MGLIAIRISYLIYWHFVRTSAQLLRKIFHCFTDVVLLLLLLGLCITIFFQNFVTDLKMIIIIIVIPSVKVYSLVYHVYRGKMAAFLKIQ